MSKMKISSRGEDYARKNPVNHQYSIEKYRKARNTILEMASKFLEKHSNLSRFVAAK